MAEPEVKAARIEALFPWLLHWCIADTRIGGFRSDSFAVNTSDGLMVIDPLPLEQRLEKKLAQAAGLFLTHGNHQRSAWRLRREIGAPVYAPVGAIGRAFVEIEREGFRMAGAAPR